MFKNSKPLALLAEEEKINTKLVMLSKEPDELYVILEKIVDIVRKKDFEALMQISNYELFLTYFCCNNDSMSLIYEGKYNYFEEPITYEELYGILEESKQCINAWDINDYEKIRSVINYKTQLEYINATQSLGFSPFIVSYDLSQPIISMLNFIFFKSRYEELKKSNAKKKEIRELYESILSVTLNGLIDRYKSMKTFFNDRKNACSERIKAINELMISIEKEEINSLTNIPSNWHIYLTAELLEEIYSIIMKNQKAEYNKECEENKAIKSIYEKTKFIKYLYDHNIDPNSLNKNDLEIFNNMNYEELITKIEFFKRLSINIYDILIIYKDYLLNMDIKTINLFNNYLDKGIIKKQTIISDLTILNKPQIIEINYSILRGIIDVNNIHYKDSLLTLNTLELKNRLTILAEYNLSINNYMFLLSNIEYLNIYDLIIENNIPKYLFISICKTHEPINTIKKIIICKQLDIQYENNGKLIKEVNRPNSFMCPNEDLNEYLDSSVEYYLPEPIKGEHIGDIKSEEKIKNIDDNYRDGDIYMIGDTQISRPKVLRNLQTIKEKNIDYNKYLFQSIISDSILTEKDILEVLEMVSMEKTK